MSTKGSTCKQAWNFGLAGDATSLDFEAGTPGAVGGSDAIFTGFGLASVSVLQSGGAGGDVLNSGVFGNALGSNGGVLSIVAPSGAIDNIPLSFGFVLQGTATQFGFRIIDQINNNITVEVFSGGNSVGSLSYLQTSGTGDFPNPIVYFESDVAFDEFRVTGSDGGGWALDDLTLANVDSAVPEPSTFVLMGGALALAGLYRRNRSN